ncbi:HNH endonuclease signature motif containing protein [Paracoccus sp. (in: a-proteobacteria)]|uniref:HNH endonuclease signature motif containing protein n=1 Tax=Paracoccus sp. TaxID=267 RepID=UPI00405A3C9C
MGVVIAAELLPDLLEADYENGRLYWKHRTDQSNFNRRFAGKEAFATVNSEGHRVGSLNNRIYMGARIIWALKHGRWPETHVAHRDGNKSNIAISNLFETNASELAKAARAKSQEAK